VTSDPRSHLQALADALPADAVATVPVAWLRALLAANRDTTPAEGPPPDLTIAQVAERFGRAASTIRGWIASGHLGGAYHFRGRELRIPASAVLDFEARQRPAAAISHARPSRQREKPGPDLSGWRNVAS